MPETTLLGPQRQRPTVTRIARGLGERVALVTAGWQEHENDPPPRGLGRRGHNLGIYRRSERVFDEDRELAAAHRERQLELKRLQRLYRMRLDHAIAAWRELTDLAAREGAVRVDDDELDHAVGAIRALDRHHQQRVDAVHAAFERRWRPSERPSVQRQRRELAEELEELDTVVVAGGHVAVLLNRLRLFDFDRLIGERRIVAWSAGAMVLARRVVLFHDRPPWGEGNAELLDAGLAVCGELLPLPDAARRLDLDSAPRVSLLARRFSPLLAVGLDERSCITFDGDGWRARGASLLDESGEVRRLDDDGWEEIG